MKWSLGGLSQLGNRRCKRTGHELQGRYQSLLVSGERVSDSYHFRIVADDIYLDPARATLAGGTKGARSLYRWSNLPASVRGKGLEWLVFDRVVDEFSLVHSGRGRRAYQEWLKILAAQDAGRLFDEAM
jgi:hypothetical protein